MKKGFYFLMILFFALAACKKETTELSEFDQLKAAHLPIPMKVSFTTIHDLTYPMVTCTPTNLAITLPGKEFLKGNATHLGAVDETKSYAVTKECNLTDPTHLKEIIAGAITHPNGDSFNFTGWAIVDLSTVMTTNSASVTGEITITDGTGKLFEGVKGTITMTEGTLDFRTGEMDWNGEGYLIYE
jgi:hypothetical protein